MKPTNLWPATSPRQSPGKSGRSGRSASGRRLSVSFLELPPTPTSEVVAPQNSAPSVAPSVAPNAAASSAYNTQPMPKRSSLVSSVPVLPSRPSSQLFADYMNVEEVPSLTTIFNVCFLWIGISLMYGVARSFAIPSLMETCRVVYHLEALVICDPEFCRQCLHLLLLWLPGQKLCSSL
jgi:hypothetical protein